MSVSATKRTRRTPTKYGDFLLTHHKPSDNDHKLDSDTATLTHNKPVGIDVKLVTVESAHREPVFSHSELVNSPVRESAATDVNTDHAEPIPRLVKPKPVVISNSAQPVCLNTAGQSWNTARHWKKDRRTISNTAAHYETAQDYQENSRRHKKDVRRVANTAGHYKTPQDTEKRDCVHCVNCRHNVLRNTAVYMNSTWRSRIKHHRTARTSQDRLEYTAGQQLNGCF